MNKPQKIKYTYFEIDQEKSEILFGIPIGENQYEISQIPVLALGVTKGDILEAIIIDQDEPAEFITFTKRCGAKLIQIPSESKINLEPEDLKQIVEWSCELKDSTNGLNIQIPIEMDETLVIELLESKGLNFVYLNPNPFDGNIFIPL